MQTQSGLAQAHEVPRERFRKVQFALPIHASATVRLSVIDIASSLTAGLSSYAAESPAKYRSKTVGQPEATICFGQASRQTGRWLQPERPRALRLHKYVPAKCCLDSWENLACTLASARYRCRYRYKGTT
jgi:hypothetical protein